MVYKLVTFNLKRTSDKNTKHSLKIRAEAIKAFLEKTSPDILGTQELTYPMLETMKEILKEYSVVGTGRNGGNKGEFTAIFYKKDVFDLIKDDTFWLSGRPKEPNSRSWLAMFPRICTWCILKIKETGKIIRIYNTHLDHLSPLSRIKSINLINKYAEKYDYDELSGTILMGDFNASPKSSTYKHGLNFFEDSTYSMLVRRGFDRLRTYHGFRGKVRGLPIDYIFTSKNIKLNKAFIDNRLYAQIYPSDHYPVIAEVTVN